ncbi:MAG TPA: sortase [Candidatus Paceibacterota bacterium]
MGVIVTTVRAVRHAWSRKWSFLVLFLLVFVACVALLARFDLLPDPNSVEASPSVESPVTAVSTPPAAVTVARPEAPVKIEIPSIGVSATIANPRTTDAKTLDAWLLKGAVRWPTSGKLGEDGNVVLFGHSSYLPIVKNPAYKTFNEIQKLKAGDRITVYSLGTAYTYQVRSVAKESANGNAAIPLQVVGKVLTLATCNTFASKSDRFVVTADFVESHPLGV